MFQGRELYLFYLQIDRPDPEEIFALGYLTASISHIIFEHSPLQGIECII